VLDKLLNRIKNGQLSDTEMVTPENLPAFITETGHHTAIQAQLIEDLAASQLIRPKLLKNDSSNLLPVLMKQEASVRHQFLMSAFKFKTAQNWYEQIALVNLIGKLVASTPVENKNYVLEILSAIRTFTANSHIDWLFLSKLLVKELEDHSAENTLDPDVCKMLSTWHYAGNYFTPTKEYKEFLRRIEALISQVTEKDILGTLLPSLGLRDLSNTREQLITWISTAPEHSQQVANWLLSCVQESGKTKPTDKWLKTIGLTLKDYPETALARQVCDLLDAITTDIKLLHKLPPDIHYRKGVDVPEWGCGVAWYASYYLGHHAEIRLAIDQLANYSLKKYPGVGPLAAKLGNACLRSFAYMQGMEGISLLFRYKAKASNRNVIKLTETLLNEAAERQQMSRSDLEDLSVPQFGLDEIQRRTETFDEYGATLSIRNQTEAVLEWQAANGKAMKSVPSAIKETYKSEIKQLQLAQKELQTVLKAQSSRIENAYLQQRSWRFSDFTTRYVQHPVLRTLAARLIWRFEEGAQQGDGIFWEGRWVDRNGQPLEWLSDKTTVQLWHPLGNNPDVVLQWREWLMAQGITQPFKQAYREIYIVTPPELRTNSYSNRFAAHIIRQHQFSAIAGQRDWHYTLQGQWDSHNTPYRLLPNWNYKIEFWVEPMGDATPVSDSGVYVYINTDQVRFYHGGRLVNMPDVPPILFSELMRDVDLFVGVCSIGNDPSWQDSGEHNRFDNYWRSYAFSEELAESGKIRRAALERLIPRLKIGPQCHFTDKYLVVKGKKHTYKIHCGSGNILMSPNDQYLCIVPDSSSKPSSVYLPFEGDRMLSIIISKALMLAEDDKITDTTILRQL
jgi:hypothetical protein